MKSLNAEQFCPAHLTGFLHPVFKDVYFKSLIFFQYDPLLYFLYRRPQNPAPRTVLLSECADRRFYGGSQQGKGADRRKLPPESRESFCAGLSDAGLLAVIGKIAVQNRNQLCFIGYSAFFQYSFDTVFYSAFGQEAGGGNFGNGFTAA